MKFLLPLNVRALGRDDLVGRAIVPFYINPQSFNIQENKIINSTLTKGGYSIQYWGEELTTISVGGTTGSGGIEAVNILRAIYRNEINVFNDILKQRAENMQQEYITAFGSNESLNRTASFGGGVRAALDDLTSGGFSNFTSGAKSAIEEIVDAATGISDSNPTNVELVPSLGAFATSLILYWQGEKFQGYIKDFKVDENAATPGNFDYSFSFTVVKRSGVRKNFAAWHRNPYDSAGNPVSASIPKEGARLDELTFPTRTQIDILGSQINTRDSSLTNNYSITSKFRPDQNSQNDRNNVGINRNQKVRGS